MPVPALAEIAVGGENTAEEAEVSEDTAVQEEIVPPEESVVTDEAASAIEPMGNETVPEEINDNLVAQEEDDITTSNDVITAQSTGDNIAEGTWGTCAWEIDSSGTLTVHAGVGANLINTDSAPWYAKRLDIKAVVFEDGVKLPEKCGYLFRDCSSLESFDSAGLDTSGVAVMSGMFSGCSSLESIDVSDWDTSRVTTMLEMFRNCSSLKSLELS
ncbi:MAG: BspA family leucine-rich repeat surface protein, partial [Atopobiaceae bacterium]|nr:BspA family leucine-rich repeat surface protein [Atopobiaceae bacterium]